MDRLSLLLLSVVPALALTGGCTDLIFDGGDPERTGEGATSPAGACRNDADVLCDALPPACPARTVPGIAAGCWTGYCIPTEVCSGSQPAVPGSCEQGRCDDAPPACPPDTTAGVNDSGCYTGYCIPAAACAPASAP